MSIHSKLDEALEIYREIEEKQNQINNIYKEAKAEFDNNNYIDDEDGYDKKSDIQYLDCLKSYTTF